MKDQKIIFETISQIEELRVLCGRLLEPKKTKTEYLLDDLKKYLADGKKPLAKKHEIISQLPLLHVTICKAIRG